MPSGVQSEKLGLTEGLVGGAMNAALSTALNCPDPIRLFEITSDICLPISLGFPLNPVKSAIATGKGSTCPELIFILKSSAKTLEINKEIIKKIIPEILYFNIFFKIALSLK
jgi:hypothetical protein